MRTWPAGGCCCAGPRRPAVATRVDAIGNLFIRRAGTRRGAAGGDDRQPLDTQPTGGKFDGVYGVLAGLEVIESLNDHGMRHRSTRSNCAVWCNEEGSRFPMAMMGSAVWSGPAGARGGLCA